MKKNITKQFLLERTNNCLNDCKQTGIYKIYHIYNTNILYIGSASSRKKWREGFLQRWAGHCRKLNNNAHNSTFLQNVVNKYGIEGLRFEIVEICEPEICLIREQFYLDTLKPFGRKGYNSCKIAGSSLGVKLNHGKNTKKVCKYSLKGEFIKTYNSLKNGYLDTGVNITVIKDCCKKRIRYGGNYIWRYYDETLEKNIESVEHLRIFKISCYYEGKLIFIGKLHEVENLTKINKYFIYNCINKKINITNSGWLFRKYSENQPNNINYILKDKYFFTVENEKQEKVKFNTLISLCNYLNVSRKKFDKQFKKINTINFKNLTIKKQKYERLEK